MHNKPAGFIKIGSSSQCRKRTFAGKEDRNYSISADVDKLTCLSNKVRGNCFIDLPSYGNFCMHKICNFKIRINP